MIIYVHVSDLDSLEGNNKGILQSAFYGFAPGTSTLPTTRAALGAAQIQRTGLEESRGLKVPTPWHPLTPQKPNRNGGIVGGR